MKSTLVCFSMVAAWWIVPARAQQEGTPVATASVPGVAASNPAERPFLFSTDPSLPAPGQVLVSAGLGNVTRSGEERPVGAGQLIPTVGAEVGLFSRMSLYAESGFAFASAGQTLGSPATLQAGAHFLLSNPTSQMWRVALQASYGLDFTASSSVRVDATVAWNYERVRALASVNASRTFRAGADGVDLGATAGVSVALPAGFRAGAEFVATDLEEMVDPANEGGAAAFAGPTVGWEWGQRLQLVAGPAIGVGPGTTNASVLARAAATIRF